VLLAVIVASLVLPLQSADSSREASSAGGAVDIGPLLSSPALEAVSFTDPVDTTLTVPEYPLVSRALMLEGGSTDAIMDDFDGDGITDLAVLVSDANLLCVFFGQVDGVFLSWPSLNVSLDGAPIALKSIDRFNDGGTQIVVLARETIVIDQDHFVLINITSKSTAFQESLVTVTDGASGLVVGDFIGDSYPDVAIVSADTNPETTPGTVSVFRGPYYSSSPVFIESGRGAFSIAFGDFDNAGNLDIAVSNRYDCTVEVFLYPLSLGMSPNWTLTIDGSPYWIAAGYFNSGSYTDLVVACQDSSSLQFFYQGSNQLPSTPSLEVSISTPPSRVVAGDMNSDGKSDLLVSSESACRVLGFMQESSPLWSSTPSFTVPCGAVPLGAVIGDLTGDGVTDIGVSSARDDWSGSSMAIYPGEAGFSNSNMTVWMDEDKAVSLMATGDIDGDDLEDLILAYPSQNAFGYILGFSDDTNIIGLGFNPEDLLVADLDGDGLSDVITANRTHSYAWAHFGKDTLPLGSMSPIQLNCSGNVTDVVTGDFNGDGLNDVVATTSNGTVDIFINTGSVPAFDGPHVLNVTWGVPILSVTAGDFDSDGLDDIAYPNSSRNIDILIQDDSGEPISLPSDQTLAATTGPLGQLWAGDITGDWKDDIIAMELSGDRVFLFDQESFGDMVEYDTVDFPEPPSFVSVVDVTDDGHPDIVTTFPSADLLFLYRQSGSSLPATPSMTFVTGAYPSCAVSGDGTSDHRGDLLVLDSGSHSISAWEQINFAPVAHSGGPYITGQGDWHQFNGSATTGYSEIPYMEYSWDFGDGDTLDWAREPAPIHQYMSLGNFTVNLSVMDPAGLMDSDSTWIIVTDSEPHTDFTWSPLNPTEGEDVVFEDTTYSYDEVVLLNWTVDGVAVSEGLEGTITMVFDHGPHTVTLTATDSDGSIVQNTKYVYAQALDPEIELVADSVVDEGDEAHFEVIVDERFGDPVDPIVSYEWDFSYDGAFAADEVTLVNTTTHVFGAIGDWETYTVAVRVTDSDGDTNTTMISLDVMDIGPSALVSLSVAEAEEGVPFSFIDETYTYDGISYWNWTLTYPDSSTRTWSYDAEAMADVVLEVGDGDYSMRLEVGESDGDSDVDVFDFAVQEIAPFVTLTVDSAASSYSEFQTVMFHADVESYDSVESYEWDFISLGAQFVSDMETDDGDASYSYNWVGNYTAKVRVNDSDGSAAVQEVDIEVVDAGLTGSFESDVIISRNDPNNTSVITFYAGSLADSYPDISTTLWEFGDGDTELQLSAPADPVTHTYAPTRDYILNVTLMDNDGNNLVLSGTLNLVEPAIDLVGPGNGSVVNSGTPIRFTIGDDSPPLVYVRYSVDGGTYQDFETLYSISTDGWDDGTYVIDVVAEDKDGNIAREGDVTVTIDDTDPSIMLLFDSEQAYGGDKVNITIQVDDDNIGSGDVVLFVTFPGDDSPTSLLMHPSGDGVFYALVEVPKRTGEMEFFIEVSDLAGNAVTSETYSVTVELRFIDAAWPYLLVIAVAAALGTGVYFMRETTIAVDETFVIYSDGRLLAHSTRRLKPGMDDQVLSGMFVAVQDFIKDSFKDETSFRLRKLDFGEKSVLVEKGEHLFLAVVLHGKASKKVARRMKGVLDDIERAFAEHLVDWDGDLDKVRGVNDRVKRLYSKAPVMPEALRRKEA